MKSMVDSVTDLVGSVRQGIHDPNLDGIDGRMESLKQEMDTKL